MEKVRLGDVCTINGGYAFKSDQFSTEGVPVIRIGNITKEGLIIDEDVCYDEKFWNENDSYRIAKNDILIAMSGATVGKSCINNTERKLLLNQRVAAINCDNNINLKYIFYSIDSEKFSKYIMTNSIGCAQPNISLKQIANFEIPAVCLEEQNRIADELDKVTDVINKRKQQISKLDELVKARFVELFGDVANSPKYGGVPLGTICSTLSGGTPTTKVPEYYQGDIPWISTPYLGNNHINGSSAKAYITEDAIKNSATHLIPANTIMFGIRVGVGKSSIIDEPMCANQDIVALMGIDTNKYNLLFVKHTLDSYQSHFDSIKKGATILGITTDDLKKVLIPNVDIGLQNQFATFVEQTDKSKLEVQKSLEKLELLKKALMQKYFG